MLPYSIVMSTRASAVTDGQQGVTLRSFPTDINRPDEFPDFKIWQAARATSAAPAYFERLIVGDNSFVDGGLMYNNPVQELLSEAVNTFGTWRPIGSILSLGCGVPLKLEFSAGPMPVQDLIGIMTNGEHAHGLVQKTWQYLVSQRDLAKYWRFNLSNALSDGAKIRVDIVKKFWPDSSEELGYDKLMTAMDDWRNIDAIRKLTDEWLQRDAGTKAQLDACVQRMCSIKKKN